MNLCSKNHDEICFESNNCPLCEMRDEKDDEIDKLTNEVDDLTNQVQELS